MKCLVVQIFLQRDSTSSLDDFLDLSRSLGRFPEVDVVRDGFEISVNYFSENLPTLWQTFQQDIFTHQKVGPWLKKVAVIGCEGECGWDDALLLYHYDSNEQCDSL